MSDLFRLLGGLPLHPAVEVWFASPEHILRRLAQRWFARVRACGPDVRELLHDGCPTACVEGAAFAYVNAFSFHASIGFFYGADLPDPAGLLEGAGRRMRHVKLRWGQPIDEAALAALVSASYDDIRRRLEEEGG